MKNVSCCTVFCERRRRQHFRKLRGNESESTTKLLTTKTKAFGKTNDTGSCFADVLLRRLSVLIQS